MNKSELIRALSEKAEIPIDDATDVVEVFFKKIRDALMAGDRVEIRGFGSFKMKEYGQYAGRNPKTGQTVNVIPKRLPFFRPGKELKDFVNS